MVDLSCKCMEQFSYFLTNQMNFSVKNYGTFKIRPVRSRDKWNFKKP